MDLSANRGANVRDLHDLQRSTDRTEVARDNNFGEPTLWLTLPAKKSGFPPQGAGRIMRIPGISDIHVEQEAI